MSITVRVPAALRSHTGGQATVAVEGQTIAEVIKSLDAAHPGIKGRLLDGEAIRPFVLIFLDDEDVRFREGMATAVEDGGVVSIVPAVAGG